MIDFLNSSEASGLGRSMTSARKSEKGARFRLGENAFVLAEDGTPLCPGGTTPGRLAVTGHIPLGYYKDEAKTAATFPVIDGVRCAVPGDYATVEAGWQHHPARPRLGQHQHRRREGLPRGGRGGDKLFPGVRDALVVGIPNERFGQAVAAAVEFAEDAGPIDRAALTEHLRGHLAGYKLPRVLMPVASIGRAAERQSRLSRDRAPHPRVAGEPARKGVKPCPMPRPRMSCTKSVTASPPSR